MTQEEINKKALEEYPECWVPITPEGTEFEDEVGKELNEVKADANKWQREAYARGLMENYIVEGKKSPFTGGKIALFSKKAEFTFRGEKFTIDKKYYQCLDTGEKFTDADIDDDNMWTVFRAWCRKQNFDHFSDIPIERFFDRELKEEINVWTGCEALPEGVHITPLPKAIEIVENTARHFAGWQKEKMFAEGIEGEVIKDINNKLSVRSETLPDEGYKFGDKVKIIICKDNNGNV